MATPTIQGRGTLLGERLVDRATTTDSSSAVIEGYRYWLKAEGRACSFSGLTPLGAFSGRRPTLRWAMLAANRHIRRVRRDARRS